MAVYDDHAMAAIIAQIFESFKLRPLGPALIERKILNQRLHPNVIAMCTCFDKRLPRRPICTHVDDIAMRAVRD